MVTRKSMSSPSAELSSFYYTLKGTLILNKNKINKTITRKCLKLFHHTLWLFNIWHISSCELFWEYEVKCMHCGVWKKFLHFTLKNKFHKKWNGIFPRWQIVRAFFLANRNHFLLLLRFSWSAYTSFCSLEQIMCHMFEKFCCHTSFRAINSSLQSWGSWEQWYLYRFLSWLLWVTFSSDHLYFLQYFYWVLRHH